MGIHGYPWLSCVFLMFQTLMGRPMACMAKGWPCKDSSKQKAFEAQTKADSGWQQGTCWDCVRLLGQSSDHNEKDIGMDGFRWNDSLGISVVIKDWLFLGALMTGENPAALSTNGVTPTTHESKDTWTEGDIIDEHLVVRLLHDPRIRILNHSEGSHNPAVWSNPKPGYCAASEVRRR